MSWNDYITDMVSKSGGKLQGGAIIGLDGKTWARSNNFDPSLIAKQLIAGFNDPSKVQAGGIMYGNKKLKVTVATNDEIHVFTKETRNNQEYNIGVCAMKGVQCIVIGYFDHYDTAPRLAAPFVGKVSDYLRENGY